MARNLQSDFQGSCDAAPTPEMGTDPQLMKSTGSQKFFASSKSPVGHGELKRAGCSAGKGRNPRSLPSDSPLTFRCYSAQPGKERKGMVNRVLGLFQP